MTRTGLKKLIESFDATTELPVEVSDVQQRIVELGFQDEIVIDGRKVDTGRIRGVFYQYKRRPFLYSEPILCTVVGYNENLPPDWQRVSCCKELMHIFDEDIEQTDSFDELNALLEKSPVAALPFQRSLPASVSASWLPGRL